MTLQSNAAPPSPGAAPYRQPAGVRQDAFGRQPSGPLAGIVVADFSRVLAGPYCTMLLADMGAAVIKVESPSGDETRAWKPPVYEDQSTYYLSINRNKRAIALDFANPDDVATAQEIAASADVVLENFKPGGLDRFGLDYASVAERHPAVVYASITGFGTAGGAALPGYDLLVQAMSGLMSLTGDPELPAYRSGVAVFDVITGLHAAVGVLSALHERSQSGRGQRIEVNLMSSALSGMVNQTGGYLLSGKVPTRMGNEHPSIYPYEPMPTADGDIVLAIGNDRQFRTLCGVLGSPALATDPRFATPPDRSLNRAGLRPILQDLLACKTAAEWFDVFTEARLPCAPINDVRGGIEFAQRLGLEPVVEVGSGDQSIPGIRNPITFSETPASYDLVPPGIDADRADIVQWLRSTKP
ncbi:MULTISPECIES: CaiB/BaiF CoA-transferase family protein [Arthrobacter]|uniref:CoA transferase n=1 Tax=Arthrobacter terricola TaxID=2547396 RepID=A0A4R5KDN7_9MICC|nr:MULTISPECIES: CoA transferase [Arthrobacter]MBT8161806.1 CoA transferase [Arthrobacter sp. GN70]TDF92638.1 CoA transferase [Arthrobacter terricola]